MFKIVVITGAYFGPACLGAVAVFATSVALYSHKHVKIVRPQKHLIVIPC
jgi:hypothetical protein